MLREARKYTVAMILSSASGGFEGAWAVALAAVAAVSPGLAVPFGVDVLWDPRATLAVAKATGARFAREVFTAIQTDLNPKTSP